jgi:hypothetical protein
MANVVWGPRANLFGANVYISGARSSFVSKVPESLASELRFCVADAGSRATEVSAKQDPHSDTPFEALRRYQDAGVTPTLRVMTREVHAGDFMPGCLIDGG